MYEVVSLVELNKSFNNLVNPLKIDINVLKKKLIFFSFRWKRINLTVVILIVFK